jgi:xanthine dehydrogenase small subunit
MSQTIRFILNGEKKEVSGISPTTTLLQYLREEARLKGTKEGCAEGDCGACTLITAKLDITENIVVEAINSCIAFLPTLDGKEIITVEKLGQPENMHPVQKEMVDCHASQCGFCTPGFVMSLSAMIHNHKNATTETIQDAIAGNLCRCTGYRPILSAAKKVNQTKERSLSFDKKKLKTIKRNTLFTYKHDKQTFFAPQSISELEDVLDKHTDATLLSGSTDVGLWVTKHHKALNTVIYLGNIDELQQISHSKESLEIGANVSYSKAFLNLSSYDESFEELLRRFASVQIRNAGTIGGNIANGSPIGDGPPPLIALGTKITLRSKKESRTINLENFFIEYGKQDLRKGEFLEKIIVPIKKENTLFKTYKISKRFDQDISAVCGAFALEIENNNIVNARIAFGGMAGTPHRALKTEEFLNGKKWTEETALKAMEILSTDYTPLTDMRASAEYREKVAKNLLYRFYIETKEPDIQTRVYGYGS